MAECPSSFRYESELNHTGICVFFFKTSLRPFFKVCYLVPCMLLITFIVLPRWQTGISSLFDVYHCKNAKMDTWKRDGISLEF